MPSHIPTTPLPPDLDAQRDVATPPRSVLPVRIAQISAGAAIAVAWLALAVLPTRALEEAAARVASDSLSRAGSAVLREVWSTVARRFYDPDLHGVDPDAVINDFADAADAAGSPADLRAVINNSLSTLNASHTRLFTPDEAAYYEVLDVFNPDGLRPGQVRGQRAGPVSYVGIGCVTDQIDGRAFVTDVYPTGPADAAGLRVGDEIISAAGRPWGPVEPFADLAGQQTTLRIRRSSEARAITLPVVPERIRPRELYLRALRASATEVDRDGARLAYVRIRSYAHQSYQDALEELIAGAFADADGLILDLRAGWGGAQASYTDAFNPAHPHMQMRGRGGEWSDVSRVWDKPLVVLIDHGTRSGKEMVADALQRAGVATLVGTPTAGAVLGGATFPMSDGSLLMVAVSDVRIDGRVLEHNPVLPDIHVERPIPYCNGADPQLQAAYDALAEAVRMSRPL